MHTPHTSFHGFPIACPHAKVRRHLGSRLFAQQSLFVDTVRLAAMPEPPLSPAALSKKLFGTEAFTHMHYQKGGEWCVFSNRPYVRIHDVDEVTGQCFAAYNRVKHFHGTTLWQAQKILTQGFKTGLHQPGSASSPCGIWGCTRRGDCLDRTHLVREWSRHAGEEEVSGWDAQ